MARLLALAGTLVSVLGGCVTTQQAEKAMGARFDGQPSDAFFAKYGAPGSSFALQDGGKVYRWRGGETTIQIPAEYKTVEPAPGTEATTSHTSTHTSQTSPNTTVTESTSTSFSVGVPSSPQRVLVAPARTETLFCEADITVDSRGIITNIHAKQDTRGAGLSMSRCAEVFDVK